MATYTYIFVFLLHLATAFQPEIYDVTSQCGQTIFVTSAIRLVLNNYDWPLRDVCEVKVKTTNHVHDKEYVSVRFLDLDLGSSFDCSQAKVDVLNTFGNVLSPSEGVCGLVPPFDQPYESSGSTITIRFTRQSRTFQVGSFDILATAVGYGFCDDDAEFGCTNGKCVAAAVTCDSYNNCGDDSDETFGCLRSVGAVIGIVCAVLFAVVVLAAIAAALYRRRTYGRVLWGSPTNYGVAVRTPQVVKAPPYAADPPPYQN